MILNVTTSHDAIEGLFSSVAGKKIVNNKSVR